MSKNIFRLISAIFVLMVIALYALTMRGSLGNPTPVQIEYEMEKSGQAFETSQERSRYAMILAMYHERRIAIDTFASMGTPDIGYINGHYFSFFPPGASLLAYPLFVLGTKWGMSQLAVFLLPTIFAIGSMWMIFMYVKKLGLPAHYGLLAALLFAFSTNAWGYSVTLYAHVISSFFILTALYAVSFMDNWRGALIIWLSYAIAVFIDFPNLLIFIPLALVAGFNSFAISQPAGKYVLKLKPVHLLAPLVFIGLMLCYGYYNYTQFGSATRLSNTIPRVQDLKEEIKAKPESGREAVGALHTRNMLEGFRSFIISHDRGIVIYTPVALLAILGLGALQGAQKKHEVLLLTVPVTCLVLYTMFGDPYGGWAFGSRYILAVMPELMILAVIGLSKFSNQILVRLLFTVVFIYSTAVSALAPLTTNVIPPFVEARHINLQSDYRINIRMLQDDELNSFIYNHVLNKSIPATTYYAIVLALILPMGLFLIWYRTASSPASPVKVVPTKGSRTHRAKRS